MPNLISIPTFKDKKGFLTVIERCIKFPIKRVYYIYDIKSSRGGHKHKKTIQFLVCLYGKIKLIVKNNNKNKIFILSNPKKGVLLYPKDWHKFTALKKNTIILVLASEFFSKKDYINEK
jgi:hypothetical protein